MDISQLQRTEFGVRSAAYGARSTERLSTQNIGTQNSEPRTPNTQEEAAQTFEKVLIEQFVGVMTDQLFKSNLSGEEGPGWMKAYGDTQRKILTEVLSDHLVENKTFNISSTLLEQWQRQAESAEDI